MTSLQTLLVVICWISAVIARDLTPRDYDRSLTDLDNTIGLVDISKDPELSRTKRYMSQQWTSNQSRFRSVHNLNLLLRRIPAMKNASNIRFRRNQRLRVC